MQTHKGAGVWVEEVRDDMVGEQVEQESTVVCANILHLAMLLHNLHSLQEVDPLHVLILQSRDRHVTEEITIM